MLGSDERLINLAINQITLSQIHDNPIKDIVRKDKLTEPDRQKLFDFIQRTMTIKPKSMGEMKIEMLTWLGYKDISYGNTLSCNEVKTIYAYFKQHIMTNPPVEKKDE